jgi:hypothetical protein
MYFARGQHPAGELKDKSPKYVVPDFYSSCYGPDRSGNADAFTAILGFRQPSTIHLPHDETRFLKRGLSTLGMAHLRAMSGIYG